MKKLVVFFFLFLLFYFEPEQIGPITFSQLWKIPFFIFLFWQVIILRTSPKPLFLEISYARAGKNLFNGGIFLNYFVEIVDFLRYMMFPLLYEYVYFKIKDPVKIDKLLLYFAQFIILSSIPFLTGWLESKGRNIEFQGNVDSHVGLFQNPHAASITTAIAVIVVLAFSKENQKSLIIRVFNYFIIILGLYVLFATFVRTGYAMFAVGLILLYLPKKVTLKGVLKGFSIILILTLGFYLLLESSEVFYNRIFDIRYGEETSVGSGRLIFWETAIDLWSSGNYFELIFGHGYQGLINKMYEETGLYIFAHSELFTQLGQNGLLGLIFFLSFLFALYTFINRHRKNPSYRLALTTFVLYTIFMLTQGGVIFPFDVFLVLILIKLQYESFNLIA